MARTPLTLAATVTAALPDAEVVSAGTLSAGGEGRFDSALVTLSDGRRVIVRVPNDDAVAAELAAEALALRALTDGVRALLDFRAPHHLGSAALQDARALVTDFIGGYLVDAEHLPTGRGAAPSLGRAIAQIHALPGSVVRQSGLPVRSAQEVRADVRTIVESASATGRVPVRLMVRWRDAVEDNELWHFETTVVVGGARPGAFVFADVDDVPTVVGMIDWHALSIGDPAIDLQFLSSAGGAADDVYRAYVEASHRAPDDRLRTRARLHAELGFAKWLLHGRDARRDDIVDDAGAMLDALADAVRDDELVVPDDAADVDDALALLERIPTPSGPAIDTSMHTDAFDPDELGLAQERPAAEQETAPIDPAELIGVGTREQPVIQETAAGDDDELAAQQRAARAAIDRWASHDDGGRAG